MREQLQKTANSKYTSTVLYDLLFIAFPVFLSHNTDRSPAYFRRVSVESVASFSFCHFSSFMMLSLLHVIISLK